MWEKLKHLLTDETAYLGLLLLLVAITSFGLGRQSVTPQAAPSQTPTITAHSAPSVVVTQPTTTPSELSDLSTVEAVVASRNGTRFHLPECPGAKQISESNRITFASVALARAAGYTPAQNCPELGL